MWQKEEEEAMSSPWPGRPEAPELRGPQRPSRTLAPPEPAGPWGLTPPEDAPPSLARTIGLEKRERRRRPYPWKGVRPQEAIQA